ncbi:BgTH12-06018 [Blumeria graminis f. sp. triticale]|uniref:Vacuolar fusion protein MON1 n=3 Tax=Blumeria graminis TaxID=34373 RepID=A0A381LD87_BLUGR|nr:hypothetical protein BGT96224_3606 [Blumeria graminis f. sp. tritici 96224]CAD6504285.1 BgTH12-06018 [Blumeria graminis f. sp. triticale]VDB91092.1 Bgt-3606 [Blumeria graminis f. sp. tritici]
MTDYHTPSLKCDSMDISVSTALEDISLHDFEHEFSENDVVETDNKSEDFIMMKWKSKFKHYFILSSAGKPIFSRHGDQSLINSYIGIIHTIISYFQNYNDSLMGFVAGDVRFAISIYGPLYFVAISRLGESDSQLRVQLEALYMQILSTLTLPTLSHLFANRPNTDLRRPLEGTETLLSSLADSFTKGSPSALLSALECLNLRESERTIINNTLLNCRSEKLLYGLLVAGNRLVSVVRPKRHSLHPSDLQLIFNMIFEAKGVRAGGGENWIPICLPGFNNKGYLYMYVSFLNSLVDDVYEGLPTSINNSTESEVAIILISTYKESFHDQRETRNQIVRELKSNSSFEVIKSAVRKGRPGPTRSPSGTSLKHFLYKSRPNVQFVMPDFAPDFIDLCAHRRLMIIYHKMHASIHAKNSHLKALHYVGSNYVSLGWTTPTFEFYCISGPRTSEAELTEAASQVIQWIKTQEQRLFITSGAVF